MTDKNIYQRINAIMTDCDYLQKEAAQQGKGVRYDTVIAMLRALLIKHGVVMVVRQTEMEFLSNVGDTKQKIYQGKYEMDLVNMDKPEEVVTHSAYAHGMDGGDKAPGKAQTYAVKIMLVKGFGIETGIDEESRAEKQEQRRVQSEPKISAEQVAILWPWVTQSDENGGNLNWSERGIKVLKEHKINVFEDLPASKFEEVKQKLGIK